MCPTGFSYGDFYNGEIIHVYLLFPLFEEDGLQQLCYTCPHCMLSIWRDNLPLVPRSSDWEELNSRGCPRRAVSGVTPVHLDLIWTPGSWSSSWCCNGIRLGDGVPYLHGNMLPCHSFKDAGTLVREKALYYSMHSKKHDHKYNGVSSLPPSSMETMQLGPGRYLHAELVALQERNTEFRKPIFLNNRKLPCPSSRGRHYIYLIIK